jgi:hypothetical protein
MENKIKDIDEKIKKIFKSLSELILSNKYCFIIITASNAKNQI